MQMRSDRPTVHTEPLRPLHQRRPLDAGRDQLIHLGGREQGLSHPTAPKVGNAALDLPSITSIVSPG